MIKALLAVLVPLLLPVALYGLYVQWAKAMGRDLKTQDQKVKPLVWALGLGVVLMLAFLLFFRFYLDPEVLSHPDRRGLEPRPPTSFPSEYGSPR